MRVQLLKKFYFNLNNDKQKNKKQNKIKRWTGFKFDLACVLD